MFESLVQDVRYSFRKFWKNPLFTLTVVVTLGLGIGPNTALFSVIDALLLRALPYHAPQRIVQIEDNFEHGDLHHLPVSVPEFVDYSKESQVFESSGIYDSWEVNLSSPDGGYAQRIQGSIISSDLFRALGVSPKLGRPFLPEENQAGRNNVLIISYAFWRSKFNGSSDVLNRNLILDGKNYTVVGVMPEGFYFPDRETEVWTPIPFEPQDFAENNRGSRSYLMIGRLRDKVTLDGAQSKMQTFAAQLKAAHPDKYSSSGLVIGLTPIQEAFVGDLRTPLFVLLAAVGFVLLISCANVANLLLARAAVWQKEVDVRVALGAAGSRIVRQFLTESILLALLGGALGLTLAVLGKGIITATVAGNVARPQDIAIDARVLGFTVLISLLTGILFGLAPAFQSSSKRLYESLKDTRSTAGVTRRRLRDLLIVVEVSMSLVLLIGAGLMIRSLHGLQNVDPGFEAKNVTTMKMYLPVQKYNLQQRAEFYKELLRRLEALPGVQYVGAINQLPLGGGRSDRTFLIEGMDPGREVPDEEIRAVSPQYFHALGIPLLKGRYFNENDTETSPKTLLINQAMADKYWRGQDVVGKRMAYYGGPNSPVEWREIVGVVGNVRHFELSTKPKPEVYAPFLQFPRAFMYLVLRSTLPPATLASEVRREVQSADKDQAVYDVKSMDQIVATSIQKQRVSTLLLGVFACLALFLSSVGLYGALSYSVTQRTRELGVRMALGAQRGDVLRLIISKGMMLVAFGTAIGMVLALMVTRVLSSFMYNVSTRDPLTFMAIPAILAAVGMLACLLPALNAMKVDPVVALRYE
jgi:putative ABC transport system permease protein